MTRIISMALLVALGVLVALGAAEWLINGMGPL